MKKLIYLIVLIVALSLIIAGCGIPVVPPTEQNEPGTLPNRNPSTIYVPRDYGTIQDAITAATSGEIIIVTAGTYNITSTLALNDANLVLKGEAGSKPKITTSGSNYLFNISAPGVTIENFEIEKTDTLNQNIIYIGADNVTIKDNLIHGQFVMGNTQVERAMEITYTLTGLNIDGNIIHSLRQPAYINASQGTISNNDVYNTKGWVIVSQSNLTFTDNTWGDGALPNYYDIAIIKDKPEGVNNYPDIVTMSEENNDAIIENQHSTYSPAILSIVHVDKNTTSAGNNGSVLDPYHTIADAFPRVASGGTIYVAAGTYDENLDINKKLTMQGVGKGTDPSINTIIDPSSGLNGMYIHQPVNLMNLRVTGAPSNGIRIEKPSGSSSRLYFSDVTWENVASSGNGGRGVEIHNGTDVSNMEITSCEFVSNVAQGLRTASDVIVDGLVITDSTFNGNSYGIYLQGTINDVTILRSSFNDNIGAFSSGLPNSHGAYMTETGPLTNLHIEDSEFKNNSGCGLMVWNTKDNANITITGTLFQNNDKWGVFIHGNTLTNVLIQDSEVQNNDVSGLGYYGIDFNAYDGVMDNVAVHYTNITGHTVGGGVKNRNEVATAIVDATCNWWGDVSGPKDPLDEDGLNQYNPDGLGDSVTEYVRYDPWIGQEGMVTGGGWIMSPAGAYTPDTSLFGKATFGFVSRYKKGAAVPTGKTQFNFQVADLNFHSDSCDWLVVAGAKAKFKGTGTINGTGDYGFMLSAIDADINENDGFEVDRFRIKIWDIGTDTVIYDNHQDDEDGTEIGGGQIVIHKAK